MKKVFFSLAIGAMWLAASVQAATLLPATNPDANFTATVDIPTGNITINLAISEALSVFDDASNPLGSVLAGSTSPTGVLTLDLPGGTEQVSLTFAGNIGTPGVSISGPNLFIPAIGSGAGLTQPQLLALLGNSTFGFSLASLSDTTGVFDFVIATLPPTTTGTPEPAVAYTVGLGLFTICALRLRKRA